MPSRRVSRVRRIRIGSVSIYPHHGAWWVYYRQGGQITRRKLAPTQPEAERLAAQINAQLTQGIPTLLAFQPIGLPELRSQFLDYHEHVLKSSIATVNRYRAATQHLEDFTSSLTKTIQAHEIRPDAFTTFLRKREIACNGHPNTAKRRLRDKGVRFILETCRSMYTFAGKRRHLPPYSSNPFSELPLDRFKIEDAKPIFVFNEQTELAFLKGAAFWDFSVHFTLAKTGLRIGELVYLLIEDLDLVNGWLHVRNKTALGWRIKTGTERSVPLLPELILVLQRVIADRNAGPVFLQPRFSSGKKPLISTDAKGMAQILAERSRSASTAARATLQRLARTLWRDSGATNADAIRMSFIRRMISIGHPEATCPKSWRHSFATLLQDANVDPLIRQQTLGHKPSLSSGLGMTANYTHTRPETQKRQIEAALRSWPSSLNLAAEMTKGIVL
jgi:integrase